MLPLTKALMSISGKITGTKWEHGKLKNLSLIEQQEKGECSQFNAVLLVVLAKHLNSR